MSETLPLDDRARRAFDRLAADLRRLFGDRLLSVIAYAPAGERTSGRRRPEGHALAVVAALRFEDLAAAAALVPAWSRAGLAVPLLVERRELERTLDVFALEYRTIAERRAVIAGEDPFEALRIDDADVRRACERQIKGHLVHLREGYLESAGRPAAVVRLVAASAPALRTCLRAIARLSHAESIGTLDDDQLAAFAARAAGADARVLARVLAFGARPRRAEAAALMPAYLEAVERLWTWVDSWRRAEPTGLR
ncbi:MAG TPA: hypothetical protein VNI83_05640 [Vicinamibacterales bacterium]|nr:hypothetical protein [Vicinamibacterales bacterium]